jgi:hypothetical protein
MQMDLPGIRKIMEQRLASNPAHSKALKVLLCKQNILIFEN